MKAEGPWLCLKIIMGGKCVVVAKKATTPVISAVVVVYPRLPLRDCSGHLLSILPLLYTKETTITSPEKKDELLP